MSKTDNKKLDEKVDGAIAYSENFFKTMKRPQKTTWFLVVRSLWTIGLVEDFTVGF